MASAPRARHLATSPPLRIPPATTRSMSSARPTSSKGPAGLGDGRHQRDPGLLGGQVGSGAGAALGAVEVDHVRTALGRHAHIVVHPGRPQLELDRDLVVGGLPDLLDLQRQVVGSEPVGVPGPASGWSMPAGSDRISATCSVTFWPIRWPPRPTFAALADEELHRVGQHQMVGVEAVAALDELVVPLGGQVALGRGSCPPRLSRWRCRPSRLPWPGPSWPPATGRRSSSR